MTGKAVEKQIQQAIKPMYLEALRNNFSGFNNTTPIRMIQHLYDNYENIKNVDLEKNKVE